MGFIFRFCVFLTFITGSRSVQTAARSNGGGGVLRKLGVGLGPKLESCQLKKLSPFTAKIVQFGQHLIASISTVNDARSFVDMTMISLAPAAWRDRLIVT